MCVSVCVCLHQLHTVPCVGTTFSSMYLFCDEYTFENVFKISSIMPWLQLGKLVFKKYAKYNQIQCTNTNAIREHHIWLKTNVHWIFLYKFVFDLNLFVQKCMMTMTKPGNSGLSLNHFPDSPLNTMIAITEIISVTVVMVFSGELLNVCLFDKSTWKVLGQVPSTFAFKYK